MLGLEARDGELRLDPRVPEEIGRICIRGLHAFGAEWDVEAIGAEGDVRRAEGEPAHLPDGASRA
jgi:hypothetical protein